MNENDTVDLPPRVRFAIRCRVVSKMTKSETIRSLQDQYNIVYSTAWKDHELAEKEIKKNKWSRGRSKTQYINDMKNILWTRIQEAATNRERDLVNMMSTFKEWFLDETDTDAKVTKIELKVITREEVENVNTDSSDNTTSV